MSLRKLSRVAVPAAMAALTVAAGVAPSQAVGAAWRWHVAAVTNTPPADQTALMSVAASSRTNAWAAGVDCPSSCVTSQGPTTGPLVVEQWNGTAWAPPAQPLPAGVAAVGPGWVGIGSSSASDAWVFATDANGNPLGASWNGTQWTQLTLPSWFYPAANGYPTIDHYQVEDFGPNNVWVFNALANAKYAAHYANGAWTQVHMPAMLLAASATSPKNLWAVGATGGALAAARGPRAASTLASARGLAADMRAARSKVGEVIMRWNGRKWVSVRMPKPKVAKNRLFVPFAVTGLSTRSVWVNGTVINPKTAKLYADQLLHWNGRRWTRINAPVRGVNVFGAMTPDGKGGVQFSIVGGRRLNTTYLMRYWHKRWTVQLPPKYKGKRTAVLALAHVPGTASEWGVGATSMGQYALGVVLRQGK